MFKDLKKFRLSVKLETSFVIEIIYGHITEFFINVNKWQAQIITYYIIIFVEQVRTKAEQNVATILANWQLMKLECHIRLVLR